MEPRKKDIQLEWDGKPETFTIREFTLKERNEINRDSTAVKIVGKDSMVSIDAWKLQEQAILKALVKAPFEISLDNVLKLPPRIADAIYSEIEELNGLDDKKK